MLVDIADSITEVSWRGRAGTPGPGQTGTRAAPICRALLTDPRQTGRCSCNYVRAAAGAGGTESLCRQQFDLVILTEPLLGKPVCHFTYFLFFLFFTYFLQPSRLVKISRANSAD